MTLTVRVPKLLMAVNGRPLVVAHGSLSMYRLRSPSLLGHRSSHTRFIEFEKEDGRCSFVVLPLDPGSSWRNSVSLYALEEEGWACSCTHLHTFDCFSNLRHNGQMYKYINNQIRMRRQKRKKKKKKG